MITVSELVDSCYIYIYTHIYPRISSWNPLGSPFFHRQDEADASSPPAVPAVPGAVEGRSAS